MQEHESNPKDAVTIHQSHTYWSIYAEKLIIRYLKISLPVVIALFHKMIDLFVLVVKH